MQLGTYNVKPVSSDSTLEASFSPEGMFVISGSSEVLQEHPFCYIRTRQGKTGCTVFDMTCSVLGLMLEGQKLQFFVTHPKKVEQDWTWICSRSLVCAKDVNALLILIIGNSTRKTVSSSPMSHV